MIIYILYFGIIIIMYILYFSIVIFIVIIISFALYIIRLETKSSRILQAKLMVKYDRT